MNRPTNQVPISSSRGHQRRFPRTTILAVTVAGPVVAAAALWLAAPPLAWMPLLLVVAASWLVHLAPIPFGLHDEVNLDEIVLVVAMPYLAGPLVAPALALGVVLGQAGKRRAPIKIGFNAGAHLLATSAAVGAAYLAGFAGASLEVQSLLALAAALLKTGLDVVLLSLVTARLDGVPLGARIRSSLATVLPFAFASGLYALLTLLAMQQTPWALLPAAGVAALFVLRSQTQPDRREMYQRRLVEAALELHNANDRADFERIVEAAVRDLFGADGARLARPAEPFDEGVHAELPGRPERLELIGLPGGIPINVERRPLLATLGSLVAAALDRLGTLQKLGRESERDPLTDAFNRRRFEREFQERLAAAQPHVLALVDLDGFKAFNDAHGHLAGDALLRGLVADLRGTFRGGDGVFRLGGDEFALLLAGVPLAVARQRLEAFTASRDASDVDPLDVAEDAPAAPSVGLSIGLAAFPEHATTRDGLMALADAALYRVKRRGGSGILAAETPRAAAP